MQPGSHPVIPAQVGVADAEPGGDQPDRGVPADGTAAWAAPAWAKPADDSFAETADTVDQDDPAVDQPPTAGPSPADLAADQPALDPGNSPAAPETATGMDADEDEDGSGDAGPLRLVRIGAEPEPEPWPEDPWLPGSRRPDRRALIIGVVVIAGLLAVASTAWLVGVNPPPQAGSAHGTHLARPSQLGSGHAQPSQALSGQPRTQLVPDQPACAYPDRCEPGAHRLDRTRPDQPQPERAQTGTGHSQAGHSQAGSGHSGTSHSGTGQGSAGHPGASQTRPHRTGSRPGRDERYRKRPDRPGPERIRASQNRPERICAERARASWLQPLRTGQSGSGGRTTRSTHPTPHPRRSTTASRGGGTHRHASPGIVSIARGLAGREDARRVAALLDRYFAAVNHREYRAYARLFAQPRQLTPREFAWGYRTSHDSRAVLAGISALKGGLKATVTFTSHQDPAQSPDHSSCIDWRITLFLHQFRPGTQPAYLIGMPPAGYRAGLQACRFAPRSSSQGRSSHRTTQHRTTTKHRSTQHRRPAPAVQARAAQAPLAGATTSNRRHRRHLAVESSGSIIAGCWM